MLCIYFFIYSLFLLIDRVYSSSEHSIFYLNLRVPRKPNTRKKENQAFLTVLMRKVGDHDLWLHTWGEGLPWGLSGKESTCQGRRPGSDPWVWRIPWRRAWQPTPVFLPGESHGQRCLVGYSPWGCKESNAVHFSCSAVSRLFVTPWTATCQASLSIINSWSLLKLTSVELVMPSNHLILCHPLLLLPSIFPSVGVFSNESVLPNRWPTEQTHIWVEFLLCLIFAS